MRQQHILFIIWDRFTDITRLRADVTNCHGPLARGINNYLMHIHIIRITFSNKNSFSSQKQIWNSNLQTKKYEGTLERRDFLKKFSFCLISNSLLFYNLKAHRPHVICSDKKSNLSSSSRQQGRTKLANLFYCQSKKPERSHLLLVRRSLAGISSYQLPRSYKQQFQLLHIRDRRLSHSKL